MIDRILSDSQSLGFCQSDDFAAAASRLNEIAPLQRDTTLRGFGWLSTNMPDDVEAILAGFEAAEAAAGPGGPLVAYKFRIEETRKLLTTSGIDWSTQLLQDLLPVVGQLCGWSEHLVQRVQGIGVSRVLVTAEQVEQEWQAHLAREAYEVVRKTREDWDALSANVRSQIEYGQLTREQVIAAVSQLWS